MADRLSQEGSQTDARSSVIGDRADVTVRPNRAESLVAIASELISGHTHSYDGSRPRPGSMEAERDREPTARDPVLARFLIRCMAAGSRRLVEVIAPCEQVLGFLEQVQR